MFLYIYNIPAKYWILAIPYVPIERLIYALGITIFYLFTKKSLETRQTTIIIRIIHLEFQIQEKTTQPEIQRNGSSTRNN